MIKLLRQEYGRIDNCKNKIIGEKMKRWKDEKDSKKKNICNYDNFIDAIRINKYILCGEKGNI